MSLESGLKYVDLLCEPDDNICTLKGILNGLYCDEHGNVDCEINDCMPILRPLDLTKEIEHGGEKFVPIVELAKIASSKLKWAVAFKDGQCYIGTDVYQKQYTFFYSVYEQSFYINSIRDMKHTPYQFKLFQKLIEWHFDICNLISKNQAIDINTLETNPYK